MNFFDKTTVVFARYACKDYADLADFPYEGVLFWENERWWIKNKVIFEFRTQISYQKLRKVFAAKTLSHSIFFINDGFS